MDSAVTTIFEFIFWGNAFLFLYVAAGYPVLAMALGKWFPKSNVVDEQYYPTVTLIISAYNEEQDIRQKLENTLKLSYPKDKLEIIVISDASSDSTDAIVEEFSGQGVKLHRMEERGGKTAGLNAVVPHVKSEIVVFSDANAFYKPDVIKKFVRNFSDPQVGCVTGDSQYVGVTQASSGSNEKLYWDYDRRLKIGESAFGSMVGSDGAIFAIRKGHYSDLGAQDINDFVLPLRIVGQGFRCIFEREAICEEASTVQMAEEFSRKVRVVNRSWNALWKLRDLLNPFAHGWFAIQLWSHKVLRWLSPLFLLLVFLSSLFLSLSSKFFLVVLASQMLVYGIGLMAWKVESLSRAHWVFSAFAYLVSINVASVLGVGKSLRGHSIVVWEPVRSADRHVDVESKSPTFKIGFFCICTVMILGVWSFPVLSFWSGIFLLVYIYFGYPLLLQSIAFIKKKPWVQSSIVPSVTLLVVAYNEEEVLKEKLENCLELEYPKSKLSILVCSDGSTDRTTEILEDYQDQLSVICFPERSGKAAVIEKVVPNITSEIVVFTDANTFLEKDAIEQLVRNFADDSVGAVSGKVSLVSKDSVHGEPEHWYYRYEWYIHGLESLIHSQIGVDGAMYAIRRRCFPKHVRAVVNDDFYVGFHVALDGMRVVFSPDARGRESSEGTLKSEFIRRVRITSLGIKSFLDIDFWPKLTQPFLLFQLVSHKILRWFTPFLMANVFVTSLILKDISFFRGVLIVQLIFYGYAVLGYVLKSTGAWLSIPMYFCLVNFAAGVGVVKGFLYDQTRTWERLESRRWVS